MKLSPAFIGELLSRIDIVDIIEPRIQLKKISGANFQALCPFHQEKTPSFSVSQSKQFYYCFGCKASGNAITFLMSYDKLSYLEAVEFLASKVGLKLPDSDLKNQNVQLDSLLMGKSSKYYKLQLSKYRVANDYLLKRGLSTEIIDDFMLGYSPPGWQNLATAIGDNQKIQKQLIELGMLIERGARVFDRFRNRIMFPIHNKKGQIIAFGGRSLDNQSPKYLNSPETSLFHKSKELYGLYQVLQKTRSLDSIIVVEGYLDVISLHQFGITNAVATLGTAISSQHIRSLFHCAQKVIFCFDGDLPGKKAAWKALESMLPLMNEGNDVRFLFLPNNEDPDSFVRRVGYEGFNQSLKSSLSLADFFFKKLIAQTEINSVSGKTRFAFMVDKLLQKIPPGIFGELMYNRLAQTIDLSPSKVNEILKKKFDVPRQSKKADVPINTMLPPVKLAIALLTQKPQLLEKIQIPATFSKVGLKGVASLKCLIAFIERRPKQTTGSLLEFIKEEEDFPLFEKLATIDLLIPEDAWQNELEGAISCILELENQDRIQQLLAKGNLEGLTTEEKLLLQELLLARA